MSVMTPIEIELEDRYFIADSGYPADPISGERPRKLKFFAGGQWHESKTAKYMPCYNPSTGAVIAYAPQCTADEVESAVQAAVDAFPSWSDTPVGRRVQVLFRMKALVDAHLDELTYLLAQENGKKWEEAMGDVLKVVEVLEFACGAPNIMKGDALMNVSSGYDTTRYNHPVGVFAGIAPWNFPAMIPQGWMVPICVATGNCMVLKAASFVPQSAMRITELWQEAGLPAGVLNLITTSRNEAEILLRHPEIRGVSFVGSTSVGLHIYKTAAEHGKRVQSLTEAKNHALVLRDCKLDRTAQGIINAFCGCAGERCMALPVIVVENAIADKLIPLIVKYAREINLGAACDKSTGMGPVVNQGHKDYVLNWIETGIQEGAELILDGRKPEVPAGCQKGFYIGPTIFDKVTEEMSVGREEVFGPVLCIKRVDSFEEGLKIMNDSRFANGSVIYTQSGYYARKFAKETHGGMVGINVGIPVPVGVFGFTGQKQSFFGDLHMMGRDGFIFYTESRNVTSTWFAEDQESTGKVDTWDGTMTLPVR
jgi:malonate-semialdehyde dehydrogenase (acetylating)/methylmalonate-semialdehyde dehydrogenase